MMFEVTLDMYHSFLYEETDQLNDWIKSCRGKVSPVGWTTKGEMVLEFENEEDKVEFILKFIGE